MAYVYLRADEVRTLCETIFEKYRFSKEESATITDVLLTADLFGIESHGVQRLIRYASALDNGYIDPAAKTETVFATPCSAVWQADRTMGQVVARAGMEKAMEMAKQHGFGAVAVRG